MPVLLRMHVHVRGGGSGGAKIVPSEGGWSRRFRRPARHFIAILAA